MQQLSAFVITLPRAIARKAQVARIVANCPVECQVIDAVDGKQLSPAELNDVYKPNLYNPRYPFKLGTGEVGCFLSHRKLWQRIVDENLSQALIVEDDIDFEPDLFSMALSFASEHATDGDYVQFQVRPLTGELQTIVSNGEFRIVCPELVPLRTSAQLVTREAAARLLKATRHFDRPIDTFLQMHWLSGVRMTAVDPSPVEEISRQIGGSMIGAGRRVNLLKKLQRELFRPIYRYQIAMLSRRQRVA